MLITASLISQEKFRPHTRTPDPGQFVGLAGFLLAFFHGDDPFRDQIRSGIIDETVDRSSQTALWWWSFCVPDIRVMADILRAVAKIDLSTNRMAASHPETAGNLYLQTLISDSLDNYQPATHTTNSFFQPPEFYAIPCWLIFHALTGNKI